MSNDRILKVIENYIDKMPSLPVTVTKIMEICNDPKTSPVDLNRVISVDPVLMGRVMKLINSAYYGLSTEITSLVRAVIMLGINTVKNLALSTAVLGALGKNKKSQAMNMDGFWRHSLCVGVTSKQIAKKTGVQAKELEEYFIAGLLHDIGKIPLNNRLPEEYMQALRVCDSQRVPLYRAEEQVLGVTHIETGKMVLKNWRLGEDITHAVMYHHSPADYEGEHKQLVNSVALANYFAGYAEIGFAGDRAPEKIDPSILAKPEINWEFLDDLEDTVNQEIDKAKVFLNLAE